MPGFRPLLHDQSGFSFFGSLTIDHLMFGLELLKYLLDMEKVA